jgi:GDP-L-fucose synthase
VNIGVGTDISIAELGQIVKEVVDFRGQVVFNPAMPDGTPRKLLDVSKLHSLGWKHKISLVEGIHMTYSDFINNHYQSKELLVA